MLNLSVMRLWCGGTLPALFPGMWKMNLKNEQSVSFLGPVLKGLTSSYLLQCRLEIVKLRSKDDGRLINPTLLFKLDR